MATTADIPLTVTIDPYWSQLYLKQRDFQVRILNGDHPKDLGGTERMAYIREQALALADELHEALGETGWKSWATSNHLNRDAYKGELADLFIFLMNLMLVADITPAELMDAATRKVVKNNQRQDNGYDGVTEKCPGCKRAYDDHAVKCTPSGTVGPNGPALHDSAFPEPSWCDKRQAYLDENGSVIQ